MYLIVLIVFSNFIIAPQVLLFKNTEAQGDQAQKCNVFKLMLSSV